MLEGNLRSVHADGTSSAPERLGSKRLRSYAVSWSRDGSWIVMEHFGTGRDVSAMRVGTDTTIIPIANTAFSEGRPSISPDGRWVMYQASTTGAMEAYVRPFPNASAGLYQVSTGGGSSPKWSRDGKEIFYVNSNSELVRVAVAPGNSFTVTDQRVLFSLRGVTDWDVAPDGRRFIMIRERDVRQHNKLVVVENFFEELKAKVPAK